MRYFGLVILVFLSQLAMAQRYKDLYGSVSNTKAKTEIAFATIQLFDIENDSMCYGAISDTSGRFIIKPLLPNTYIIKVSCVGYENYYDTLEIAPKSNYLHFKKVSLKQNQMLLEEVEITAGVKKMQAKANRVIFVPDSMNINRSRTGLDLLRWVPGVKINKKEKSIQVLGSKNVLVLIDGSFSVRSIEAIDPKDIQQIEVINNPSSDYDSEVANVVNIVLKEERKKGFKLFLNSDHYQSKDYFNNAMFQLDYETKAIRVFTSYSFSTSTQTDPITIEKQLSYESQDTFSTVSTTDNYFNKNRRHEIMYGVDFKINPSNILNFTGKFSAPNSDALNNYTDSTFLNNAMDYISHNQIDHNYEQQHQNYTLFYKHKFDEKEHELKLNSNFYIMDDAIDYNSESSYIYPTSNSSEIAYASSTICNKTKASNTKLDYIHPFSETVTIKAGSQIYYRNIITNNQISTINTLQTSYSDWRSALYLMGNYSTKKFALNIGLRAEQFDINVDTSSTNQFNLLPDFSAQFSLSEMHKLAVIASKKLRYPHYSMIANYSLIASDSLTEIRGNPHLKPETSYHFEVNHTFINEQTDLYIHSAIFTNLYSNQIRPVVLTEGAKRIHTYVNIDKSSVFGLYCDFEAYLLDGIVSLSFYNSLSHFNYSDNRYNGLVYETYFSVEIEMPLNCYLLVDASYSSKSYLCTGTEKETPSIEDISIYRAVLRDRGTVSIGISNPFISYSSEEINYGDSYYDYQKYSYNFTQFYIGFSYYFTQGKRLKHRRQESLME